MSVGNTATSLIIGKRQLLEQGDTMDHSNYQGISFFK
jgi:hypothetical protein